MPVRFSRELTAAINQAKHTEHPGVGHDRWMKASEEPELWASFAQKKAVVGR